MTVLQMKRSRFLEEANVMATNEAFSGDDFEDSEEERERRRTAKGKGSKLYKQACKNPHRSYKK